MSQKKLNVEISAYEGDVDFPEAAYYGNYVAERLSEIYKCEVEVTRGPMTKVFAYGFGDSEEDVVADVRSMVKVELWDDFCHSGYKQFSAVEVALDMPDAQCRHCRSAAHKTSQCLADTRR